MGTLEAAQARLRARDQEVRRGWGGAFRYITSRALPHYHEVLELTHNAPRRM
jgi:hypothetical protein